MKQLQFSSLEECFEVYPKETLVCLCTLKQIIFYISMGVQPKYVSEDFRKPGRLACWFSKAETSFVYKKWLASNPKKEKVNA